MACVMSNGDQATTFMINPGELRRGSRNRSARSSEERNRPNAFRDWWECTSIITKVKILAFVILPCLAIGIYIYHFTQNPGSLHNPIAVLHPLSVVHPIISIPFQSTVKIIKDKTKDLLLKSDDVSVTTNKGPIVGLKFSPNEVTGASYDAFLGIPYGRIPSRFQRAIPPESWTSPRLAKNDGPACPQLGTNFSENCLFLNVFTPRRSVELASRYPVIAFIHGGDFTRHSSSSKYYGPDFLVPKGVILVTFNYRLGANGFLTLGSSYAPGNRGLYDTQLALNWVRNEIGNFGGDPGKVTLMGHGAGAVLAMYHYLSPRSQGLFRYVVAQSGSALADWGHYSASEGRRRAEALAQAVGCDTSAGDANITACLKATDINKIVENEVTLDIKLQATGQTVPFLPVIDTDFADVPFFTDLLENLIDDAAVKGTPLMLGFTADEGIVKFAENSCWMNVEANLDAFIPQRIVAWLSKRTRDALVSIIKRQYWTNSVRDNRVWDIVRILTDHWMANPTIEVARRLANSSYGYVFDFSGPWTPDPPYISKFHMSGVNHGFDLRYLFFSSAEPQDLGNCTLLKDSFRIRDMMVDWWTNFVKTGSPGNDWLTISKGGYLQIDTTPSMIDSATVENNHNYGFWTSLESLQRAISMAANFAVQTSSMSIIAAFLCILVILFW